MNITSQLQKTALNEQKKNQDRIKELVEKLDNPDAGAQEAWDELKTLILPKEEKAPEEKKEEETPKEETVESLLADNNIGQLRTLAKERGVQIEDGDDSDHIAKKIVEAKVPQQEQGQETK